MIVGVKKMQSIFRGLLSFTLAFMALSVLCSGCARPKPMVRPDLDTPLSLDVAIRMIAFDLFAQINNKQKQAVKRTPELVINDAVAQISKKPKPSEETVPTAFMTDAVMNADTGEEIELTKQINEIVKSTAANGFPNFSVIDMNAANINKVDFIIIGIIRYETFKNQNTKFPHLFLSAVDVKSSQVVAHSEVWISNQELKLQPTALYADSPMYMKDQRAEKVIAAARAAEGSVVDMAYFSAMETNALLSEGSTAYNNGNYPLAAELFKKSAARDDGQVLKTYVGLYQAYFKLQKLPEAEEAFAKLAEIGIKNGNLSVKFLFQVGDTSFFGQSAEIAEYDIWIRQISRKIAESQACVEISGHASRTGSAEFNKKLSDKRAHVIQKRLLDVSPVISKKTIAVGRGFEQNIVGSGTDDIRDAIDRRVEFKVIDCGKI
jgi:outer membrane protein OmpA-like peptidoglycan-associated protein